MCTTPCATIAYFLEFMQIEHGDDGGSRQGFSSALSD